MDYLLYSVGDYMSWYDRLIHLRNTSGDEVTKASREEVRVRRSFYEDENKESKNLKKLVPFKVTKSIPNYRYAYKNNDTINTTIDNLIIIANNEWIIDVDNKKKYKEAFEHIVKKTEEWKLEKLLDNIIKYSMVDGSMFINRYIDNGTIKLRILGNDGKRFKWLIIRNPNTDEIIGFKQKAKVKKIEGNWKVLKYDTLKAIDYVDEEYNFTPEEVIYIPYMEEDGEGVSAIEAVLDLAYIENKLLKYILNSARTAGGFLGIEFGNRDIDAGGLDVDEIKSVTKAFELDENDSTVVGYPYGITPTDIGKGNIPNYKDYITLIQSKIRNNLLTPDSKFSSISSNRSTAYEQLNTSTGYVAFVRFIQMFVTPYINEEIINKELELKYPDAIGHIKFKYVNDIDNERELSEIASVVVANYPDLPTELILSTYFNRVWKRIELYKETYGENWVDKIDKDLGKLVTQDGDSSEIDPAAVLGQNAYNRSQKAKADALKQQSKNKGDMNENGKGNFDKGEIRE